VFPGTFVPPAAQERHIASLQRAGPSSVSIGSRMICMAREVSLACRPLLRNSATSRHDAMRLASVDLAPPGPTNAPQHHPPIAIIAQWATPLSAAERLDKSTTLEGGPRLALMQYAMLLPSTSMTSTLRPDSLATVRYLHCRLIRRSLLVNTTVR
jgi:hypothetical protein